MRQEALMKACVVSVAVALACSAGCAHTASNESTSIREATWHANLDDCQEVRLSSYWVRDRDEGEPARTYDRLTLELQPRPHLQFESVLKSIELEPGARSTQFRFEDVEVRADETRRRVWFVDRAAGRVIATLDRDTGATTGPDDEAPPWATADGGIVLDGGE